MALEMKVIPAVLLVTLTESQIRAMLGIPSDVPLSMPSSDWRVGMWVGH